VNPATKVLSEVSATMAVGEVSRLRTQVGGVEQSLSRRRELLDEAVLHAARGVPG